MKVNAKILNAPKQIIIWRSFHFHFRTPQPEMRVCGEMYIYSTGVSTCCVVDLYISLFHDLVGIWSRT